MSMNVLHRLSFWCGIMGDNATTSAPVRLLPAHGRAPVTSLTAAQGRVQLAG